MTRRECTVRSRTIWLPRPDRDPKLLVILGFPNGHLLHPALIKARGYYARRLGLNIRVSMASIRAMGLGPYLLREELRHAVLRMQGVEGRVLVIRGEGYPYLRTANIGSHQLRHPGKVLQEVVE